MFKKNNNAANTPLYAANHLRSVTLNARPSPPSRLSQFISVSGVGVLRQARSESLATIWLMWGDAGKNGKRCMFVYVEWGGVIDKSNWMPFPYRSGACLVKRTHNLSPAPLAPGLWCYLQTSKLRSVLSLALQVDSNAKLVLSHRHIEWKVTVRRISTWRRGYSLLFLSIGEQIMNRGQRQQQYKAPFSNAQNL